MHGQHSLFAAHPAGAGPIRPIRSDEATSDILVARLRLLTGLEEADLQALTELYGARQRLRARAGLVAQGERPRSLHVLLDGWACRYRVLSDGLRQITQILVPGDICDIDALRLGTGGCALMTLTRCTVAGIEIAALRGLARERPAIGEVLAWLGAVDNAMLAERNAGLGRRTARAHLSHLLCELLVRLTVVGRAAGQSYTLPITQEAMADVLGLTSVHINRVLHRLKADGLIELGHGLIIQDWDALRREAGFRPDYLHLEGADGEGRAAIGMPWGNAAAAGKVRFD